ncbi:hypothetical protein A2U01_0073785 [Trifolium medium]|uniref:Uncharacterized protein n=1 Tax=Trifolium medium TaxID=97028 RepID=A0A392SXB3_9FABA|nr:hypothetical protein [Trifolium medium]
MLTWRRRLGKLTALAEVQATYNATLLAADCRRRSERYQSRGIDVSFSHLATQQQPNSVWIEEGDILS